MVTGSTDTSTADTSTQEPSTSRTITADRPLSLDGLAELDAPFAVETAELFASVRDHDLPTLAARCDDDLGIIDIDPAGGAEVIRDRAGWESWFVQLFAQLDAMDATTDTLVTRYDAVDWGSTGMSVVDFTQLLTVAGLTGRFHCIVTIVWKRVEEQWIEARWHASLLDTDLPEGFGQG
ncbi:MAG: nuclear transport factor 2 family protein [Nitriliruptoraceae bacterium]